MFKLAVSKSLLEDFVICVHCEGHPVEDYLSIDAEAAAYLVSVGSSIVNGVEVDPANPSSVNLEKSSKHGNAYKLLVRVNDSYIKVFVLTEVELKLFLASLKRAIDG